MTNKKKPDNVAWDEKEGYNAKILPYGSNVSAPAISHDDVATWKIRGVSKVNHQFTAKFNELKEEYKKLIDEYKWNDLVYNASYSFEPVIGEVYHLSSRESGELFLSLIEPTQWKKDYVASFRLESTQKWVKL